MANPEPEPLKYALNTGHGDRPARRRFPATVAGFRARAVGVAYSVVRYYTQFEVRSQAPAPPTSKHRRVGFTPLKVRVPQLSLSYWKTQPARRRAAR